MPKPDSIWYAGRWRSPQGVERHRRAVRESQRRYRGTVAGVMTQTRHRMKAKEARLGS